MRAVIEAVFARAGEGGEPVAPPAARVAWVSAELDDFLARVTFRARAVVLLSLVAITVLAPLVARRLGAFSSLPLRDRVDALERLERGAFAPALLAVKALLSLHYYEHPDAAREVGFDGACMTAESP